MELIRPGALDAAAAQRLVIANRPSSLDGSGGRRAVVTRGPATRHGVVGIAATALHRQQQQHQQQQPQGSTAGSGRPTPGCSDDASFSNKNLQS